MFPSASSESRRSRLGLGALAAVVLVAPSVAVAQLVNPSFETPGAGTHFDGWGQFGNVAGASDLTADGVRAAKIWGPFHGNWAVSGIYQDLPAEPGWVFEASVYAGHSGADPITGDARAILNVEWRNAIGGLISYETVDLVGASDPTGVMGLYEHSTGPAPTGTTAARLLLGFLQSPANETGSCRFDLASFARNPDAEHDALQWVDFGDRTIDFSGHSWRCKVGASMGPGPNRFSDSTENVWVDAQGHLHMAVTFDGADWACPEIALEDALGHGDYVFVTRGRVDELDPNHVLGMFLWEYQESYEGSNEFNVANEFDVELSRWGDAATALNSQFVAQPWHAPGNRSRFPLTLDSPDALATHAFLWRDGQVVCRAWHGSAPRRPRRR